MSAFDHVKNLAWKIVMPIFPLLQKISLMLGIVHHSGRQPHHLGWLKKDKTPKDLLSFLNRLGYHNHFAAWKDEGEILSTRLLANFHYQYHLRCFNDREVRGHYEKTPESKPWDHFKDIGMEPKTDYFKNLLHDWLDENP